MVRRVIAVALVLASGCGLVGYDLSAAGSTDSGPVDGDGTPIGDVDGSTSPGDCVGALAGAYTGDGEGARQFALDFQPALVIVQSDAGRPAVLRVASMPANQSKQAVGASPLENNLILASEGGFAVGSDLRVNNTGELYFWVAFPPGGTGFGSYEGNGGEQSVAGLGFRPDWLIIADEGDGVVVTRFANGLDHTFRLEGMLGVPNGVTNFDDDGFSLGSRPYSNAAGRTFHYVAWRSQASRIQTGVYIGDDGLDRFISTGFRPHYLLLRNESVAEAIHRFAGQEGDSSLPVDSTGSVVDAVKSLEGTGFRVGPKVNVNGSEIEINYLAFASCATDG